MIRNISDTNLILNLQTKIMLILSKILKSQQTSSLYFIVFIQIASFFPIISIFFKDDPLQPEESNISTEPENRNEFGEIVGFGDVGMTNIMLYVPAVFILCMGICCMDNAPKQIVIFFGYFVRVFQFLAIPMLYFMLNIFTAIFKVELPQSSILIVIFGFFMEIIVLCFIVLYTYFEIRPLRLENFLWNYENSKEFNHLILDISRALIIYFDDISPVFLCTSLMAEIYLLKMKECYLNREAVIFNKCRNEMIVVVHVVMLINFLIGNGELSLVFLSVGLILVLLLNVLNFIAVLSQSNSIPECKLENCKNMYSFYMGTWHKNKSIQNREEMSKINTHYMGCNSDNCAFAVGKDGIKITNEDIEQKITKYLKSFRYSCPESELMYEIWKIELNKTITLEHKLRDFSTVHRFVVIYVLGADSSDNKKDIGNNVVMSNLAINSMSYKWKFYRQLSCAVNMFEKMGEAMTKSLPELNEIIDSVIGINEETNMLNELFEEMVKVKEINYVCVELYLKFIECFLDHTKMPVEILDRLKRLKVLKDSEAIEENSLPCFVVEGVKNTIEKINWQAVKFLKMQKYEIKDKKFMDFVVPSLTLKELENLQSANSDREEFLPIFFKIKSQNTTLSKNIKIKLLSESNKNYYEIVVHKRNNNRNIIEILIDENEAIIGSSENHITLMYKQGKEEKKIETVFEEEIKKSLSELSLSQIVRIEFGKGCLYAGLLIEKYCPYPNMRFLALNLVKKINPTRNNKKITNIRLTKIYSNQSEFRFHYSEDPSETLFLQGSQTSHVNENSCLLMCNTTDMRSINEQLNKVIENIINPESYDYGVGIKVYRLFDKELYNIDLEDKAKYEEQFEGIEVRSMEEANKFEIAGGCLLFIFMCSAVAILGISIYLYIRISKSLDIIKDEQRYYFQMEEFSLNFNRILSVLRDTSSGLFDQLNKSSAVSIMDSYRELMKIDSSVFFSYETYKVKYDGNYYVGTLSELVEICLTHVYEFVETQNILIVEKIHEYSIGELGDLIAHEKLLRLTAIEFEQEYIKSQRMICFVLIVVSAVIYYVLLITLAQHSKKEMNAFLEPVLIVSEPEVRRILQECEKFNNVISSLYKNYEVDLQILDSRKGEISKRIKAKRTNFGISSVYFEIIVGFVLIGALILLSYFQFYSINEELETNKKSFLEGTSVIGIYTETSWLTSEIEHTGKIDESKIDGISDKLALVENNRYQYEFSEFLCDKIKQVFFNNSCEMLVEDKIIGSEWCGDSMVGFEIKNPFSLSIDIFYRRVEYNFVSNITDTFASTGVYSDPFKSIFLFFSSHIKKEIEDKMIEKQEKLLMLACVGIIISSILLLVIFFNIIRHHETIKVINKGLATLNEENKNLETMAEKDKKKNKKPIDETEAKMVDDLQGSVEEKSAFDAV